MASKKEKGEWIRHPNMKLPFEPHFIPRSKQRVYTGNNQVVTDRRMMQRRKNLKKAQRSGIENVNNPQVSTKVNAWNTMAKSWINPKTGIDPMKKYTGRIPKRERNEVGNVLPNIEKK